MGPQAWASLACVMAGASAMGQLGCPPGGVPQPAPPPLAEPPTVRVELVAAPAAEPNPEIVFDPTGGDPVAKAVLDREALIDAELKALDRAKLTDKDWAKEWAGTYSCGDGLGMNATIMIAPKAGLSYTWYGCLGLYDKNHGPITKADAEGIEVDLKLATDGPETMSYLSPKLYFVKWGDRRYLVPESKMLTLVNNYNEGGYARSGMFSIPRKREEGDPWRRFEDAPPGRPQLPSAYDKLLRDKPIALTVTKVTTEPDAHVTGDVWASRSTIEFKGGSDAGVYVGLECWVGPLRSRGKVEIQKVDAGSCTGVLTAFGDKGSFTAPKVGDVVLTGEEAVDEPAKKPEPKK